MAQVSVATISSTCLYRARVRTVCPHDIHPLAPGLPRMVGEAFTLRFIPMRDDVGDASSYGTAANVHQRATRKASSSSRQDGEPHRARGLRGDTVRHFATEEVARGRSIVGLYPDTDASRAEFEQWRRGRHGS